MIKYNKLMLLYEEIHEKINPISYGNQEYYIKYTANGEELNSNFINRIINDCVQLYNQLNDEIIISCRESKNVDKGTYDLLKNEILARKSVEFKEASIVQLTKGREVQRPKEKELPKGLLNIIELLKRSLYHSEYYSIPSRDAYFDTSRLSYNRLRRPLTNLIKNLK
jgi:hypothetical protein